MIRYKAKAGSKRSTVLSCKASTRQPVLKILKTSMLQTASVPFEQLAAWAKVVAGRLVSRRQSSGSTRRARRLLAPAAR